MTTRIDSSAPPAPAARGLALQADQRRDAQTAATFFEREAALLAATDDEIRAAYRLGDAS
jgi:hypothetical protein